MVDGNRSILWTCETASIGEGGRVNVKGALSLVLPKATVVEETTGFVESSPKLSPSLGTLRVASRVAMIRSGEEEENTVWTLCTTKAGGGPRVSDSCIEDVAEKGRASAFHVTGTDDPEELRRLKEV
ncbi:uncharacterized protein AB9W97_007293 [Spinachia spinachia]